MRGNGLSATIRTLDAESLQSTSTAGPVSNTLVASALCPTCPTSPCRWWFHRPLPQLSPPAAVSRRSEPTPRPPTPGSAKALVDKTSGTGCHAVEVVTSQRMNAAEWNAVVQNMVARGTQAPDGDLKATVEYLSKTLGR